MIMIEGLIFIMILGFIIYKIIYNYIENKNNKNIMKYKELKEAHLDNKKTMNGKEVSIEENIDNHTSTSYKKHNDAKVKKPKGINTINSNGKTEANTNKQNTNKIIFGFRVNKQQYKLTNKDPLSRAEILGFQGETEIAKILNKIPGESRTLSNLYIPAGYDKLTEVDLVYICNHGIYVIESKNFSGFVRGSDNYKYWVQYLNGKEYKFFSPVLQNENHVRYINKLIPKYAKYVQSLVVFGGNCKMSIESGSNVISAYELYDFMENNKGGRAAINNSQIQKIYETLSTYENVSDFVKDKHKRRIQSFKHKL